ncbi:selT/selW/selH selenoprotein domain protein [compost metagenome]
MAAAEHHLLAGGDISGHGAEGDRQPVEIAGIAGVHQQAFQQQGEVLALDHPERQAQAAVVAETQALLDQEIAVVLLAAEGHFLARRIVGQRTLPVQVGGDLLQFVHLVAGGIEAADHRAHAGAGDGVDLDALFLQRLEHADMGQPAGGAAGQHQADPGFGLGQAEEGEEQQAKQKAAHNASLVRRRSEAGYYRAPIPSPSLAMSSAKPEIVITYCTQCQWLLRAAWLAQELLSTFSDDLGKVSLEPGTGGVFRITCDGVQIWERKADGGFPEAKVLKQRVRDQIDPARDLGHNDRS